MKVLTLGDSHTSTGASETIAAEHPFHIEPRSLIDQLSSRNGVYSYKRICEIAGFSLRQGVEAETGPIDPPVVSEVQKFEGSISADDNGHHSTLRIDARAYETKLKRPRQKGPNP